MEQEQTYVDRTPNGVEYRVGNGIPCRIKKWGIIRPVNRYLRVVLLEDGETVHNAFFDRTYKE